MTAIHDRLNYRHFQFQYASKTKLSEKLRNDVETYRPGGSWVIDHNNILHILIKTQELFGLQLLRLTAGKNEKVYSQYGMSLAMKFIR